MDSLKRNIPLLLLQPIPLLLFPPALFTADALPLIALVVAIMWGLGWMVWRKRAWALTLSIFIQGLNVIIRLMMLLSNAVGAAGNVDLIFIVTSVLAIAISWLFLLRLDNQDIRAAMAA
ncbi:MAG TPA: hypothetical protein VMP08_19320 [Anaerolineae bacterium]|nr:hypothetical protein [Anaerolineae bacterium]